MERRYVGIDLLRRRSVIVTMDEAGAVLSSVRIVVVERFQCISHRFNGISASWPDHQI